jgi:hypothetical protein
MTSLMRKNAKCLSNHLCYELDLGFLLTLIGMMGDTFISLSFLDQILSADFLSKLSKLFEGEN